MSLTGRADLVRLLRDAPEMDEAAARLLGYGTFKTAKPEPVRRAPQVVSKVSDDAAPEPLVAAPVTERPPFWQVVDVEHRAPPDELTDLDLTQELPPESGHVLPDRRTPTLEPWSALWPRIHGLIAERFPSQAIDADALVRRVGQGRPIRRLPRKVRTRWPQRLVIWKDRVDPLVPIWDDQDAVEAQLSRWCPEVQVAMNRGDFTADPDQTVLLLGDWDTLPIDTRTQVAIVSARRPTSLTKGARVATWSAPTAIADEVDRQALRLLALTAPASWVRPGLLRDIRRLLPATEADVGTELAVWARPEVYAATDGFVIRPDERRALLGAFEREDDGLKKRVGECIERWNADHPDPVRHLDALLWPDDAGPLDVTAAKAYFDAAISEILRGTPDLQWFANRAGTHMAATLKARPGLTRAASLLWLAGNPKGATEVPDGIDLTWASRVRPGQARTLALVQSGGRFHLRPDDAPRPGVRIASVQTTQGICWIEGAEGHRQLALETPIASAGDWLRIETDRSLVRLARQEWPDWAVAMGVERGRVWADAATPDGRGRLYFEGGEWHGEGVGTLGADEFGIFEDVAISGFPVRFRLIPAGTFTMGDERLAQSGRRRFVSITKPFWLADAPVTSALWRRVIGRTHSFSTDAGDEPVGYVSWEDAQAFIRAAEVSRPGLNLQLPTEAQWEYACRAGTGTPRYGDLDAVAWYAENSGNSAQSIRQKRPNDWGLYDLLGGVWEWCSDYHSYAAKHPLVEIDPIGPASGTRRVFRGGGLFSGSNYVHAAYRNADRPTMLRRDLGFRLSRGPRPSRQVVPGGARRQAISSGNEGEEGRVTSAGSGARTNAKEAAAVPQSKRTPATRSFGRKLSDD